MNIHKLSMTFNNAEVRRGKKKKKEAWALRKVLPAASSTNTANHVTKRAQTPARIREVRKT